MEAIPTGKKLVGGIKPGVDLFILCIVKGSYHALFQKEEFLYILAFFDQDMIFGELFLYKMFLNYSMDFRREANFAPNIFLKCIHRIGENVSLQNPQKLRQIKVEQKVLANQVKKE